MTFELSPRDGAVVADPLGYFVSVSTMQSTAVPIAISHAPGLTVGHLTFSVPQDQAYYWTPAWQIGEAEAESDILAGRVERFETMDEAIEALFGDE